MKIWCAIAACLSMMLSPPFASAQTVTAKWDPNPPTDQVTNYQVCVGVSSLSCNVSLASVSAATTSYTFAPTGGLLHFVAVRATNYVWYLNRTTVVGGAYLPSVSDQNWQLIGAR
jgi:hypothetical protein